MERTFITWSPQNMITIPVMAALGWIVFGIGWQLLVKWQASRTAAPANNSSGY